MPSEFRNSIMIVSMWIKTKPLPYRQGPLLVLQESEIIAEYKVVIRYDLRPDRQGAVDAALLAMDDQILMPDFQMRRKFLVELVDGFGHAAAGVVAPGFVHRIDLAGGHAVPVIPGFTGTHAFLIEPDHRAVLEQISIASSNDAVWL